MGNQGWAHSLTQLFFSPKLEPESNNGVQRTILGQLLADFNDKRLRTVVSAIFASASCVRKAWWPLIDNVSSTRHCFSEWNHKRHKNIVKGQQAGKNIIMNDFRTWVCEEIGWFSLIDIHTYGRNMTRFQCTTNLLSTIIPLQSCIKRQNSTHRINAYVSIKPPLEVFIKITPSFILPSVLWLMTYFVSSVSGQCKLMISDLSNSSSKSFI